MTQPPQSKERKKFPTMQVATLQTIGEWAAPFKLQPRGLSLGLARPFVVAICGAAAFVIAIRKFRWAPRRS
jgi:hypothetical protein